MMIDDRATSCSALAVLTIYAVWPGRVGSRSSTGSDLDDFACVQGRLTRQNEMAECNVVELRLAIEPQRVVVSKLEDM